MILTIMYVETSKTDIIVFIGNVNGHNIFYVMLPVFFGVRDSCSHIPFLHK